MGNEVKHKFKVPWILTWQNVKGAARATFQGTNISHLKVAEKMIFPRWDMLVPWRVYKALAHDGGS